MAERELWTCPECGNRFVTPNVWHSCGVFSIDALFAKSTPEVRSAYEAFERMARELAEVLVIPQKTRVVFQTRTRFAGGSPRRDWFDASFIFFQRVEHPRFYKIQDYGKWFGHHTKLHNPAEVDEEVKVWLSEALRYGDQRSHRNLT